MMMALSLPALVVLLTVFPLAGIGGVALFYAVRARHRPSRERESLYVCTVCGHVYASARNRPVARCPRCLHLNEAVRM